MIEAATANQVVTVHAPAKVNLTLRVLGTRADGFHELESVVAAVDLADRLSLALAQDLRLSCAGIAVPPGDDNLVLKAARLLRAECGVVQGAAIRLEKRIPPGRGLGGGSSDAAAALVGLNALWACGLSAADLARLGARIGSDVPLFFGSPVSVLRGRGEHIESTDARLPWWVTLAWPDYGNPTVDVYREYDRAPVTDGGRAAATAILDRLAAPAREVAPLLVNDLEAAARRTRPDGLNLRTLLEQAAAPAVTMTGSGSAYMALSDTETEARRLADAARAAGVEAVVVRTWETGNPRKETPQ